MASKSKIGTGKDGYAKPIHISYPKKSSVSGKKSRRSLSMMNKHKRRSYKPSRGQGRPC